MHQIDDRGNVPVVEDELAVNSGGTVQPAAVENTRGVEQPVSHKSHKRRSALAHWEKITAGGEGRGERGEGRGERGEG
jgi:hypothetical protein